MDLGLVGEGGGVLTAVVGAEEQLTARVEAGPDVGLGATAVATVRGGQGGCQCGVHVGLLGALGVLRVVQARTTSVEGASGTCATVKHAGSFPGCTGSDAPGASHRIGDLSADRGRGPDGAPVERRRDGPGYAVRNVTVTAAKKTATSKSASEYTAHHLQVLEGLEAVRKRPGMYIGSTDSRGLMHCLWEIIDNAVDEALGGHCDHIEVILLADGSVEVRDNGRGIPVDIEPRTGLTGVEVVYTQACTRAASSAAARTPPPVASTGSAPRSSTPSPRASTSRSTAPARRTR